MKVLFLIISLIFFTACFAKHEKSLKLIDQKDSYYWEGNYKNKNYSLYLRDTSRRHHFDGILTIDKLDTLFLSGYEKGSNHPTRVRTVLRDSTSKSRIGRIFIWAIGMKSDTIILRNERDSIPVLPIEFQLFKKSRLTLEE